MFSRKRKREPSLIEVSEQIAQYFANIKDPCGYKCVPTLKVDVREEDVLVTVNNIEQIELSSLCELCELFKNISDVYCDFLTKSVYLVVERNQIDLLASYTYSQLGNDEKHAEIHFLQSAGKDYFSLFIFILFIFILFRVYDTYENRSEEASSLLKQRTLFRIVVCRFRRLSSFVDKASPVLDGAHF